MRFFIFFWGGVIIYLFITQIHNKLMMNDRVCFNANAYIHICMKICHIHPCSNTHSFRSSWIFINPESGDLAAAMAMLRKSPPPYQSLNRYSVKRATSSSL